MASDTGSTNPTESPGGLGLRARLVAGFVGIAALATLVATVLTSVGLHGRFDAYLERRTEDAAQSAVTTAETTYASAGRWSDDAVDVHVMRLRRKLAEADAPDYVTTVYGVGYRFDEPA